MQSAIATLLGVVLSASLLLLSAVASGGANSNEQRHVAELRLLVPDFKPVSYIDEQGVLTGDGVERARQALKAAGIAFQMYPVSNYAVALELVRQQQADGFLPASENAQRNAVARLSAALMTSRWSWFLPAGSTLQPGSEAFKAEAAVATYLNTNTHHWLNQHGYKAIGVSNNTASLPVLLLRQQRVDAVFVAERVFTNAATALGIPADAYRQVVQQAQPMGIYISKAYLQRYPETLARIDAAVEPQAWQQTAAKSD